MKKYIFRISVIATALFGSVGLSAQNFQTGYFLDNYAYSYKLNPAFQIDRTFLGVGAGNINISQASNLGITNLLFEGPNGKLVTGLNASVSPETFLNAMSDGGKFSFGLNENLLAMGHKTKRGASVFDISLRSDINLAVPRDFFAFLKNGSRDEAYNIGAIDADTRMYAEISLGKYINVSDNLKIGARVKGLVGLAAFELRDVKALVTVNGDAVSYDVDATASLAAPVTVLAEDKLEFSSDNIKPSGFGAAIDLGISASLLDDHLEVSASLLDLGGITWKYNTMARLKGDDIYEGTRVDLSSGSTTMQDEIDDAMEKLEELGDVNYYSISESSFNRLPVTVNAGVRFHIPGAESLSVGALLSTRISSFTNWYDFRIASTWTPKPWLSMTANTGQTSYGSAFGAALSFKLLALQFNAGVDAYMGNTGRIYSVPVPLNQFKCVENIGLCFVF